MTNIVVIGAGVAGLTSALLLARTKQYKVTVVARHMPGDYDIEYTSPWAGANVLPMNPESTSRWERDTWPEFKRLAADVPEAGVHFQRALILRKKKASADDVATTGGDKPARLSDALFDSDPWFRTLFDDYRDLPPDQVPEGYGSASDFTSVCINTALYLPWLVGQCRALGVVFRRAVLAHVADAAGYADLRVQADGTTAPPPEDEPAAPVVIVNCSGLLACRLGGVNDKAVQPARGQILVLRDELTPMYASDRTDFGEDGRDDEIVYNMLRAAGGGTVVGGTYQVGNWQAEPDPATAGRILRRLVQAHPQLRASGKKAEDLDVIRHGVGLRPYRAGGVRLEAEKIAKPAGEDDGAVQVVHNYGHAGWGYQGSYGCARRVVELVGEVVAAQQAK